MPKPITTHKSEAFPPLLNPTESPEYSYLTEGLEHMQTNQEIKLEENSALALQEIEQGKYAIMNDQFWQRVERKVKANLIG